MRDNNEFKFREELCESIFLCGGLDNKSAQGFRPDRNGEKGFQYIGPGFTTTPEGQAMRAYFKSIGDEQTVSLFRDSSMEFVRKLGGDPLCLVTEIPLFYVVKACS